MTGSEGNPTGFKGWLEKWANNALTGIVIGATITIGTTVYTADRTTESAQLRLQEQLDADAEQRLKDIKRPAYTDVYLSAETLTKVMDQRANAQCMAGTDIKWPGRSEEPCAAPSIATLRDAKKDLEDAVQVASLIASPDALPYVNTIRQAFAATELQPADFPQKKAIDISKAMSGLQIAIVCTTSPAEEVIKGSCTKDPLDSQSD